MVQIIDEAVSAAAAALDHLEKDGWAKSSPSKVDVVRFLRHLVTTRDFRVVENTTSYPVTANLNDPPMNVVNLGRQAYPKCSAREKAAVLAHEAAHSVPLQRNRTSFGVEWEIIWRRAGN